MGKGFKFTRHREGNVSPLCGSVSGRTSGELF